MAPRGSVPTSAPQSTTIPMYALASAHALGMGSTKNPPYDKVKPIYLDVCFLPGGGNPHLVDVEWFKRVRARHYIATDPMPTAALLEALTLGKESWSGKFH